MPGEAWPFKEWSLNCQKYWKNSGSRRFFQQSSPSPECLEPEAQYKESAHSTLHSSPDFDAMCCILQALHSYQLQSHSYLLIAIIYCCMQHSSLSSYRHSNWKTCTWSNSSPQCPSRLLHPTQSITNEFPSPSGPCIYIWTHCSMLGEMLFQRKNYSLPRFNSTFISNFSSRTLD